MVRWFGVCWKCFFRYFLICLFVLLELGGRGEGRIKFFDIKGSGVFLNFFLWFFLVLDSRFLYGVDEFVEDIY